MMVGQGPRGETWYNLNILPTDYCIMRAPSEADGIKWLTAIQNALDNETKLVKPYHDPDLSKVAPSVCHVSHQLSPYI